MEDFDGEHRRGLRFARGLGSPCGLIRGERSGRLGPRYATKRWKGWPRTVVRKAMEATPHTAALAGAVCVCMAAACTPATPTSAEPEAPRDASASGSDVRKHVSERRTSPRLVAPPALGPGHHEARSRFGLLSIVSNPEWLFQERYSLLAFDGRILEIPDTDFLQYFGLRKAWAWGGADLFLVSGETGAKICPVLYVIVEVRSSEEVTVSKAFGTCGDVLSAQLTPQGVEVTTGPHPAALPYGPNKTFTYAKGRVTPDDWY